MRRLIFAFALALFALPAFAQSEAVQITSPTANSTISGTVELTGTVALPNLQSYFFEIVDATADPNTAAGTPVTLPSRNAVTNGVLAQFNTTIVPNGTYTLRLSAVSQTGDVSIATVTPVTIDNVPGAVQATEAPPAEPTIVPRPTVVNDLPLPVGGQLDNFDENAIELMRQAGMTWIKWQIPFVIDDNSLIDVARDRINWSHERGFFAFITVLGRKEELAEHGADYYPLYADFVGRVAALQPDAIQVWNEQNLDREWPQGQIDPRLYGELLRQAYEAIKTVDPAIKVVTGAPAPTGAEGAFGLDRVWNDDRYYLGMANAGIANHADCIGIHYNEGIISPQQQSGDPRGDYPTYYFQQMLQRAFAPFQNSATPLCFSELGYLSPEGYGALPSGFAWGANTSVAEQAQWLAEAVQLAAANGNVDLLIVFNVNYSQFVEGDPQGGYAIIRPDGSCPACDALAQLRSAG